MASPQTENGFTKIANELLDVLNCCKLTDYERVVIFTIIRKTYGWGKKFDWISHGQISTLTGVPRTHVVRTVTVLLKKKMLHRDGKKIGIQKDWKKWVVKWRLVPEMVLGSTSEGTSTSTSEGTHKRKKETIQKRESKAHSANQKEDMGFNKYSDEFEEGVVNYDEGNDLLPREEKKENKTARGFRASDVVELWNKYPDFQSLAKIKKIKGKPRNPTTVEQLLLPARGTKDELLAIGVCMKRYDLEDFERAFDNYMRELINRGPKDGWAGKRYSLYDLVKNKGYNLKTYVNR